MIYSSEKQIIDCDYVRKRSLVREFLDKFYSEVDVARSRNFTSPFPTTKKAVSEHEFRDFLENGIIDDEEMNELDGYTSPIYPGEAFGLRNLTYIVLHGNSDIPDELRPLLNYHHLKRQCDEKHRQMKQILNNLNSEDSETKEVAEEHLQR
jgi:secretory phospholipase A2